MNKDEKILVSACLAGINCKYDGTNNYNEKIFELLKEGKAVLVCPEQLGGLTTPRVPSEIINNKVITKDGKDVTKNFKRGAKEVVNLAKKLNIKKAILKSKSPSCGYKKIYNGEVKVCQDRYGIKKIYKTDIDFYNDFNI